MDARGHAHLLNANILENANTLSATSAPSPLPLSTMKSLTEQKLREGVLNGSIPSASYNTACTSNAGLDERITHHAGVGGSCRVVCG